MNSNSTPKFSAGDIITRTLPGNHDYGQKLEILSVNNTTGRYILHDGHELSFSDQGEYHKVHKNVLRILPDTSMFGSKEEWEKNYDAIPLNERDNNSWWYLHGSLESEFGFDKGTAMNSKSAGYSLETVNWREINNHTVTEVRPGQPLLIHRMHIDGEVPVEIHGSDKPAVGFFWTEDRGDVEYEGRTYPHWQQRGLVCYADDKEGCEYAREVLHEKPFFF